MTLLPMSAEFLYKAGLMAMTVAKTSGNSEETILYTQKALAIFENIQKIYPEFNGIRNCIINKGIIYEDILHDYENAEIFYREFIARYPTDTLAINLASYLQYLGKTPEDIMSEIEKK
jgi:tetratricopeptide (TPR) repeat protein